MSFATWINDLRWSANMRRARRYRRGLLFSERQVFDQAFYGRVHGVRVTMPDALYETTIVDLEYAILMVMEYRVQRRQKINEGN